VDDAAIAWLCGVEALRIERGEDVRAALDAAFSSGQPMLIDVTTDPDARPPISFHAGHDPEPF
jgi:acetolactate synthase-1/2/3 large subunit